MSVAGPDLLATIVAATRKIVEDRAARTPISTLERAAAERTPDRAAFRAALGRPGQVNVIAECKRRSPSRGVLRPAYAPAEIAREYEAAGAAAISVLTEPTFFDGSLEHLSAVRDVVCLPLLRKDFVVDEYQLFEARAAGADAVLLIVAALEDAELRRLAARAHQLGLATLVEVHTIEELNRAAGVEADAIGVNNRNLRTLQVELDTSMALVARVPRGVTAVAESGIGSPEDLVRLAEAGYQAFLIGERLMTRPSPGAALGELVGGAARLLGRSGVPARQGAR